MALQAALLINAACRHNQCNILLRNHPPEVRHGVGLRSLTRNNLSLLASRAIDEVSVDVASHLRIFIAKTSPWKEMDSGVLEGQDIRVTVFVSELLPSQQHLLLY